MAVHTFSFWFHFSTNILKSCHILLCFNICLFVWKWKLHGKRERERVEFSIHWFISQTATAARAGSEWNEDPGSCTHLPHRWQGLSFWTILYCFAIPSTRSWIRNGAAAKETSARMGWRCHKGRLNPLCHKVLKLYNQWSGKRERWKSIHKASHLVKPPVGLQDQLPKVSTMFQCWTAPFCKPHSLCLHGTTTGNW